MKKYVSIFLGFLILLTLQFNAYAVDNKTSLLDSTIKGISLISNTNINTKDIKTHGLSTVLLDIDNIRNPKKPYNTNYKALRLLTSNIAKLEAADIDYVLCFTSGPGYSKDGKITSIYNNKLELTYFAQMVKELVKRYNGRPHFKGASIGLSPSDIQMDTYYKVQDSIITNVRRVYADLTFLYNLHPLTIEQGYKYLPTPTLTNILINLMVPLKGLSYPGYGAGYKTSYPLNKNALLSSLEKFKEYQSKIKIKAIVTLKTPWIKNSEVMLQDFFEIIKMLKLDYNLAYGNSSDLYDFTNNSSVIKVLDRHNR